MMERRTFIVMITGGLLAAPLAAEAQKAGKIYRVGTLTGQSPAGGARNLAVFRQELKSLGYVEGQNIVFEDLFAEGHFERFPELAAELLRRNVDVIVAGGTPHALAARKVTAAVPIVVVGLTNPIEAGLITTLARPGGNVTGLTVDASIEQAAKSLELLKETVPGGSRFGVVLNVAYPGMSNYWQRILAAAEKLGVAVQPLEVRSPSDLENVFGTPLKGRQDALLVLVDPLIMDQGRRVIEFAARDRLPALYTGPLGRRVVEAGGLMSWGTNIDDLWRRGAYYVDKILKGARGNVIGCVNEEKAV
jgi:putative ABC transport system substrate-binding protein